MDLEKNNWDAHLYDNKYSYVTNYGHSLVELLDPKQGEKILDLGSGTGDLANTLSTNGVKVTGVDKSKNMVKQAIEKYPHIHFEVQDATTLNYQGEFDAIFSNATLHWVRPPCQALKRIYHSLKVNGRFVAEFGGKGNIETITTEIMKPIREVRLEFNDEHFQWFFPSIAEYSKLMEEVGFRVTYVEHFDRPTPLDGEQGLRNFINMFGQHLFNGIPEHKINDIVTNVEEKLRDTLYKGSYWIADYKRIRVTGVK